MSKRKAEDEAKLSESDVFDAIESGNIELLQQCLSHGVDVNTKKPVSEESLLELALSTEQYEISSILLCKGADPNYFSEWGGNISPLENCVRDKKMDLVKQLVLNGVDVNKKFSNDESPLLEVVKACYIDNKGEFITSEQKSLFKLLIEKGANVSEAVDSDKTVLHILMDMINEEGLDILKIFIENGAEIKVKDQYGQSVIDMAENFKLEKVLEYLHSCSEPIVNERIDLQKAYAQAWSFIASSCVKDADGICEGIHEAEKVSSSSYLMSWDFTSIKLTWQHDVRKTDCLFTISSLNGASITLELFEEIKNDVEISILHSYNEVLTETAGCWFGYIDSSSKARYLSDLNKHKSDMKNFIETLFDTRVEPTLKDNKIQWKCDIGGMDGRTAWMPHQLLIKYLGNKVDGEKSFEDVVNSIKALDDFVLRPPMYNF